MKVVSGLEVVAAAVCPEVVSHVGQAGATTVHRVVDLSVPLIWYCLCCIVSFSLDGEPLGPVFKVQVLDDDGLLANVGSKLEEVSISLVRAVNERVGVARGPVGRIVVPKSETVFPIACHTFDAEQVLASTRESLAKAECIDSFPHVIPGVGIEIATTQGDAALYGKVNLVSRSIPCGVVFYDALHSAALHRAHLSAIQAYDVLLTARQGYL